MYSGKRADDPKTNLLWQCLIPCDDLAIGLGASLVDWELLVVVDGARDCGLLVLDSEGLGLGYFA